jgi:hypothetical protein
MRRDHVSSSYHPARVLPLCGAMTLLALACSSAPNPTSDPDPGGIDPGGNGQGLTEDSGVGTQPESGVADATGEICVPDKPLTLSPWAPPSPLNQMACDSAQLAAYYEAFKKSAGGVSPETTAFRTDPANAACLACIETPESASTRGPVLVLANGTVEANFGGCVALYDQDSSATGCGAILSAYNSCAIQECGDCADYIDPPYTQAKACLSKAVGPGEVCEGADTTAACQAEISGGGVASICESFQSFLSPWCGH